MPLEDDPAFHGTVDIREAVTPDEIDAPITIQLAVYHVTDEAIAAVRPPRRHHARPD